jgi:hypothetical protein
VLAWWAVLASVFFWPLPAAARLLAFAAIAAFPFAAMAARKRSIARATYSVVSWCFNAAGLVQGLLRRRMPPRGRIASVVLHEPPQVAEAQRRQRIA